ncbi:hypothetical protein CAEBREN_15576 [Caenorhabditis brenneri]|uniref:Uncharacterized protein n=1 Tax=Caenorhabditis brenneri TaxID=135651 RepID=G0MCM9_CAEBE|nr:hypothetical protein CAEBREN_15576 [Caenorhabditis brenneri]
MQRFGDDWDELPANLFGGDPDGDEEEEEEAPAPPQEPPAPVRPLQRVGVVMNRPIGEARPIQVGLPLQPANWAEDRGFLGIFGAPAPPAPREEEIEGQLARVLNQDAGGRNEEAPLAAPALAPQVPAQEAPIMEVEDEEEVEDVEEDQVEEVGEEVGEEGGEEGEEEGGEEEKEEEEEKEGEEEEEEEEGEEKKEEQQLVPQAVIAPAQNLEAVQPIPNQDLAAVDRELSREQLVFQMWKLEAIRKEKADFLAMEAQREKARKEELKDMEEETERILARRRRKKEEFEAEEEVAHNLHLQKMETLKAKSSSEVEKKAAIEKETVEDSARRMERETAANDLHRMEMAAMRARMAASAARRAWEEEKKRNAEQVLRTGLASQNQQVRPLQAPSAALPGPLGASRAVTVPRPQHPQASNGQTPGQPVRRIMVVARTAAPSPKSTGPLAQAPPPLLLSASNAPPAPRNSQSPPRLRPRAPTSSTPGPTVPGPQIVATPIAPSSSAPSAPTAYNLRSTAAPVKPKVVRRRRRDSSSSESDLESESEDDTPKKKRSGK